MSQGVSEFESRSVLQGRRRHHGKSSAKLLVRKCVCRETFQAPPSNHLTRRHGPRERGYPPPPGPAAFPRNLGVSIKRLGPAVEELQCRCLLTAHARLPPPNPLLPQLCGKGKIELKKNEHKRVHGRQEHTLTSQSDHCICRHSAARLSVRSWNQLTVSRM